MNSACAWSFPVDSARSHPDLPSEARIGHVRLGALILILVSLLSSSSLLVAQSCGLVEMGTVPIETSSTGTDGCGQKGWAPQMATMAGLFKPGTFFGSGVCGYDWINCDNATQTVESEPPVIGLLPGISGPTQAYLQVTVTSYYTQFYGVCSCANFNPNGDGDYEENGSEDNVQTFYTYDCS
jgi:hypothetical protein